MRRSKPLAPVCGGRPSSYVECALKGIKLLSALEMFLHTLIHFSYAFSCFKFFHVRRFESCQEAFLHSMFGGSSLEKRPFGRLGS